MIKWLSEAPAQPSLIVISLPSPGGVTARACDRLIASYHLPRRALIHSRHLEPGVGYLPADVEGGALGLGCELYCAPGLWIVQIRTSFRQGRRQDFIKDLMGVLGAETELLLLIGLPFDFRPDPEIRSQACRVYGVPGSQQKGLRGSE